MALIVNRTPQIDDDGTETTGTPFNNAWKTSLYNDIDLGLTPGVQGTALTGAQSIAVTPTTRVLRCTNATLLTIQSLTGAFDGQLLTITANGSGQVDIPDGGGIADGILGGVSSTMILSLAPGAAAPVHNGRMTIIFDAAIPRWKVLEHEQGAWLPYTPVWGNTSGTNTLGAGTLAGGYHVRGRTCHFRVNHTWAAGTAGGAGAFTYTFPFPASAGAVSMPFCVAALDASAGYFQGVGKYFGATTWVAYGVNALGGFNNNGPFVWTVSDALFAMGAIEL